jgi:hypothetical protein
MQLTLRRVDYLIGAGWTSRLAGDGLELTGDDEI